MVEIRTYDGDGSDFAELCLRIRQQEGEEEKWSPLWDAGYMHRQIEAPADDRELMVAAYDGARLIGTFFAVPYAFNVQGQSLRGTFSTCLMIDPAFRGMTPYVIEKLRRRHRDNGYAFSLGFVMGGPNSGPNQCWTGYARAYPKNCHFITGTDCWIRAFDPAVLDAAGRAEQARADEQLAGRRAAAEGRSDIEIAACREDDIPACLDLLRAQTAGADWSIGWDRESLQRYAAGSQEKNALIARRNGAITGFVGLHRLSVWNEGPIRAAVVDMLAAQARDDDTRHRLLGAAGDMVRREGARIAMALRSPMFRARAVVPAGFLPAPDPVRLVVLFADETIEAAASQTFELMLR